MCTIVPLPGGPLDSPGNAVGLPVRVGEPASVGYFLRNDTRWTLEVRRVRPRDAGDLEFLGAVTDEAPPYIGAVRGFTPGASVEGATVRPGSQLVFVAGFRPERAGSWLVRGLEVEYRLRVAGGVGPLFAAEVGPDVAVCAAANRRCDPPDAFDADE